MFDVYGNFIPDYPGQLDPRYNRPVQTAPPPAWAPPPAPQPAQTPVQTPPPNMSTSPQPVRGEIIPVPSIEDTEKKLDEIYSKDGSGKGYQKGRSGEKVVRSYIHGVLDLDRTNLICYLIFFGNNCELPQGQEITEKRLNDILRECGYTILDPSDEFDDFVIRFLNSDAPMETLIDEVNRFALDERNFYLYRLYRLSSNVDQTWSLLMS